MQLDIKEFLESRKLAGYTTLLLLSFTHLHYFTEISKTSLPLVYRIILGGEGRCLIKLFTNSLSHCPHPPLSLPTSEKHTQILLPKHHFSSRVFPAILKETQTCARATRVGTTQRESHSFLSLPICMDNGCLFFIYSIYPSVYSLLT